MRHQHEVSLTEAEVEKHLLRYPGLPWQVSEAQRGGKKVTVTVHPSGGATIDWVEEDTDEAVTDACACAACDEGDACQVTP